MEVKAYRLTKREVMIVKLALFTDTYVPDVNGVALTLKRWADYLKDQGHQVKVFAPESKAKKDSNDHIIRYKSYPFFLYPDLEAAIANPLEIKAKLDRFKPDLIHVATPFNLGVLGRRYAVKYKVPFVASYHTNFDQYLKSYNLDWAKGILDFYLNWFHQDCQAVFAPSTITAAQLKDQGYPNVKIWPRGVDHHHFKPAKVKDWAKHEAQAKFKLEKNKLTILYVGRLATEKSLDVLIDTLKEIPPHLLYKLQVNIVGDGPMRQEIKKQTKKYDLPINLLGFQQGDNLSLLYQAGDIFFFPSATETFGNVVLEALASGLPVIGAKAGGVKDLVKQAHNGILCPPGEVEAFVDALLFLINNASVRQYYAKNARAFALKQSWDQIMAELLEELQDLVDDQSFFNQAWVKIYRS